jgi:hypothetical protein
MTSANKPMQINLYDQLLTIWNELAGAWGGIFQFERIISLLNGKNFHTVRVQYCPYWWRWQLGCIQRYPHLAKSEFAQKNPIDSP